MVAIAMVAMGQKVNMPNMDPANWDLIYLNGNVTDYGWPYDETDSTFSVTTSMHDVLRFGAKWGSAKITSDTFQVVYKTRYRPRKVIYWEYSVEEVEEASSPIYGWDCHIFHLRDGGIREKAILIQNDTRYRLYLSWDDRMYLLEGLKGL